METRQNDGQDIISPHSCMWWLHTRLSLSAEGKESEGIGSTALKTTYFSPCTEIGAANEAAQLPHTADLQNLTLT